MGHILHVAKKCAGIQIACCEIISPPIAAKAMPMDVGKVIAFHGHIDGRAGEEGRGEGKGKVANKKQGRRRRRS